MHKLIRRRLIPGGVVAIILLACAAAGSEPYEVPEPEPVSSPLLVGCYYFPGHFNALRWAPMAKFQHPYPLLGYYRDGEPVVSDWHIKWAVEHGIDFFAFDWYYDYKTGHVLEHNEALDKGFLRARYRDRMRFCIFWCNEERGPVDYTEDQMLLLARTLRDRYFSQPNYLELDGKVPLVISRPQRLIERFGVEGCAEMWRKMSAEAGRQILPIALQHTDQETLASAGYGAISAYNYAGVNVPEGEREAPYDTMVTGYKTIWDQATKNAALPYIVPVSPGWDSRPWYGDEAMVRTSPGPEKFRTMCEAAKPFVDRNLQAVIIECWNEFGEGSYIEPCTQYGFGYLDAVRDAFCPHNPHHLDLTPQQTGATVPVYEEIPALTEGDIASQDGNLLYNPGFERRWGWLYYAGSDAQADDADAHSGTRSGIVRPADGGMKSYWRAPVEPGDTVEIWAWVKCEPGATVRVTAALFGASGEWLRRYTDIGTSDSTEWQRVSRSIDWSDSEAREVDIEIVPTGGAVRVDDTGIRKIAP